MNKVPVLPHYLFKISFSIALTSMLRWHEKTINVYTSNCVWQQFITNCTCSFTNFFFFSFLYMPLHNLFCFGGLLVLSVTIVLWWDSRRMFLQCHSIFLVFVGLWRSAVSRSSLSSSPRGVFTHDDGGSTLPETSVTTHHTMPRKTPAHFNRHKYLCENIRMGNS